MMPLNIPGCLPSEHSGCLPYPEAPGWGTPEPNTPLRCRARKIRQALFPGFLNLELLSPTTLPPTRSCSLCISPGVSASPEQHHPQEELIIPGQAGIRRKGGAAAGRLLGGLQCSICSRSSQNSNLSRHVAHTVSPAAAARPPRGGQAAAPGGYHGLGAPGGVGHAHHWLVFR